MLWLQGFTEWHEKNIREISWFFIGFFFICFLRDFGRGDYVWAIVDAIFIVINYFTWKRNANK